MEKNSIIFISEKWCDGTPSKGFTNNFHNLFGSLESSKLDVSYENYFLDEIALDGSHINSHVEEILEKDPSLVVISFLGNSPMNPDRSFIEKLSNSGIKICIMWPDTGYPWALQTIGELGDLVDLHVSYGGERIEHPYAHKHLWLWAPQDESLYYPDDKVSDASFVGSLNGYRDRLHYLRYAVNTGVLNRDRVLGGQRESALTADRYAQEIRTSKININFPESPSGKDQCKGRVIESIACKTLLLERKNEATPSLLEPGVEYIEFEGLEDFVEKLNYYNEKEEEAEEIASRGYEAYKSKYSSHIFWSKVLEGCSIEV
jgi:hypothetical protein